MPSTRRAFLQSGAAAALAPLVEPGLSLAAGRTRPNIVLVIIETLRADQVSAYGGRAQTPNIDALAACGIRFTRFYPERKLAYGGYGNWHYARTDDLAFISSNRGHGRRLYDLERDPHERHNIARRHPRSIDNLYAAVVGRAGGRLPTYH